MKMKLLAAVTVAVSLVGLAASAATFPALNLTPESPGIQSIFVTVDYVGNSSSGLLTASGFANALTPPGSPIAGGSFDISATLNENALTASGTLTIGGTVAGLGFNSGTLLTGTLASFGAGPGDPLEFLFTVTGGDAAGLFGSTAGVILSQSGYTGSFGSNFTSGAFQALADTFAVSAVPPVPLPAGFPLLLASLGGLGLMARRKRNTA